ncbi:Proliferation-associated protein 2G4 [Lamellibrachia satsuma]|nr:Proliferation-associated protein 2G4 [Lamellibrachia satsuma]
MAEKEDQDEQTIANDLVVTKYKMAADMVNAILKETVGRCKAGEKVAEICEFADKQLIEQTGKVFKKEKDLKKGIAFPTCVSINNCICHFSPLKSDPDIVVKDGDLVKIDMGAHVDGYAAVAAHTFVVGASSDNKVTGRKADVIMAAHMAAEAALRLVKPSIGNFEVTDSIQKACESYKCKPIEGMLSHQLKQHVIDGEKSIIQNPTELQRREHEKCEFEVHEVYAIDILVSTGADAKGRECDTRTTIYKRTQDTIYNLKMKASRQFYSEVEKRFGCMPFTLRAFEDEKKAKMGVVECVKHELLDPFAVLWEREGELVAQFKFTMLLMPNGPMKITGLPFDADCYQTEYSIEDEDLKNLLATSASRKAAKKKKKKAVKAISEEVADVLPSAPAAATVQS